MFAARRKSRVHISGGQFIARLANHFGLLTAEILGGLTVIAYDSWGVDLAERGVTFTPYSQTHVPYQRRVRRMTDEASTFVAQQDPQHPDP
ncbi:hypothetical protein Tco_0293427 [Tanacetum coccineum]